MTDNIRNIAIVSILVTNEFPLSIMENFDNTLSVFNASISMIIESHSPCCLSCNKSTFDSKRTFFTLPLTVHKKETNKNSSILRWQVLHFTVLMIFIMNSVKVVCTRPQKLVNIYQGNNNWIGRMDAL